MGIAEGKSLLEQLPVLLYLCLVQSGLRSLLRRRCVCVFGKTVYNLHVDRAEALIPLVPSGFDGVHNPRNMVGGAVYGVIAHVPRTDGTHLQKFLRLRQGGGDDQSFSCPGHSHVQKTHFFLQAGIPHSGGNRLTKRRFAPHRAALIGELHSYADGGIKENPCVGVLHIPLLFGTDQEAYGEFQSLGVVDAENAYRIRIGVLRGKGLARLHHGFHMGKEGIQTAARAVFEAACLVIQGLQIGPCGTEIHGGISLQQREDPAVLVQPQKQLVSTHAAGVLPQSFQPIDKFAAPAAQILLYACVRHRILGAYGYRIPQAAARDSQADPYQIVQSEAEHGTLHGGSQMDVPCGVVNGVENGHHKQDFGLLIEGVARLIVHPYATGLQGLGVRGGIRTGGMEQDRNIAGGQGFSVLTALPTQHPGDAIRQIGGLVQGNGSLFGILRENAHLYGMSGFWRVAVLGVFQLIGFGEGDGSRGENVARNQIAEIHDGLIAPEIFLHEQGYGLGGGILLFGGPCPAVGGEHLRLRSAETVDALLDIAHHKPSAAALRQGGEDAVLQMVGVLIFINEYIIEGFACLNCRLRGFSVLIGEQTGGQLFQIGEVQNASFPFAGTKDFEILTKYPCDMVGYFGSTGAGHRRFFLGEGKGFCFPAVDFHGEFLSLALEIRDLRCFVTAFKFYQSGEFEAQQGGPRRAVGARLRSGQQLLRQSKTGLHVGKILFRQLLIQGEILRHVGKVGRKIAGKAKHLASGAGAGGRHKEIITCGSKGGGQSIQRGGFHTGGGQGLCQFQKGFVQGGLVPGACQRVG